MADTATLRRTPLYSAHVKWGAKMVPFGGWEMPAQYSSIIEEHTVVRERVGLFDISHMGEVLVAGPNAERVLNHLLANDARKIAVGQAQYTLMCNEHGGVIDDLIVYRLEPSVYLLIINASNIETDFAWMNAHASASAVFENESDKTAALALQGPNAARLLADAAAQVPHFHIARLDVLGKRCWVARTGYTGEDGFELLCDAADAVELWNTLLARGREFGIQPCGLGARDTLRLEMCYPLNGSDMTKDTTPLEAGLGKFVVFDKGEFIGRDALFLQKEKGVARKLVAFKMVDKSPPPRSHYPIVAGARKIGEVTSGTQSPTLGIGIGMGYAETGCAQTGSRIEIQIRGKNHPAVIEDKPLLKKARVDT
ncbi:MAG TPA: glycine cleavage system aminomethyltransferase GcvT [Verrucomicrobiae bacterium]|nr:glycine cleavage system aminomethyltransferase GcvT [Verrucomicrobiae bacterium]